MENYQKYERAYFMPPEVTYDWVKRNILKSLRFGAAWILEMETRH